VSRTKDVVYRQSGEADYDEAGSPPTRRQVTTDQDDAKDQAEQEPDAVITRLDTHR
jgi:hypothetical protein